MGVPWAHAQPSVWIDDLTWPEVRDAIAAGKRTAIVYTGSSEQNGPHMVIGKHNFVAHDVAQRIAEELGDALVYPMLPFAMTGNAAAHTGHMRFPGSVTLPPDVYFGVVRAVAQSALAAGFKVVAMMGDHGGGQNELARAAKELDARHRAEGARVIFIGDLYAKTDAQFTACWPRADCRATMSMPASGTRRSCFTSKPRASGSARTSSPQPANRPACAASPALATPEIGKLYLDLKVENAVKQIRSLVAGTKPRTITRKGAEPAVALLARPRPPAPP